MFVFIRQTLEVPSKPKDHSFPPVIVFKSLKPVNIKLLVWSERSRLFFNCHWEHVVFVLDDADLLLRKVNRNAESLPVLFWQPRHDGHSRASDWDGERRAGTSYLHGGSGAAAEQICAECSGECSRRQVHAAEDRIHYFHQISRGTINLGIITACKPSTEQNECRGLINNTVLVAVEKCVGVDAQSSAGGAPRLAKRPGAGYRPWRLLPNQSAHYHHTGRPRPDILPLAWPPDGIGWQGSGDTVAL